MTTEKTPWFVAERSAALAGLLLTARPEAHVRGERKHDDGADFFVEVNAGEDSSTRMLLVLARGTLSPEPQEWVRNVNALFHADGGKLYSLPACVFVSNVRDNRTVYAWLAEPLVGEKGATLKVHFQAAFRDLDAAAVDEIIGRVAAWYDALPRQLQSA